MKPNLKRSITETDKETKRWKVETLCPMTHYRIKIEGAGVTFDLTFRQFKSGYVRLIEGLVFEEKKFIT